MNHYIDIKLLPDAEIPATVLMNATYAKLHKILCDLGSKNIGVSFPKYKVTLGNILRIHGDESVLKDLLGKTWLGGMNGYCKVSDVVPVPAEAKFRTISRKQSTMSQSKLNRLLKRGSITEEDVKNYKAKMFTKGLDNPYLELQSGSNGHKHRRYIEFGELLDEPVKGDFDQFGLSKTATVPWF
ncbi:MAG: type I-F CRISPR-associated endoribonuclease Cas6/Csy4 [Pseudohongiellaceae bacterium]